MSNRDVRNRQLNGTTTTLKATGNQYTAKSHDVTKQKPDEYQRSQGVTAAPQLSNDTTIEKLPELGITRDQSSKWLNAGPGNY